MTEEEFRSGKREDGTAVGQSFDYMAECDKTCSTVFKPEQVEVEDMKHVLTAVAGFAEDMNITKKLLFRGKTREEVGFTAETSKPTVGDLIEALAAEGKWSPADIDILHGAVGIITEAGEIAEYLLAFLAGQPFDKVNVMEETGDISWYAVRSLRGIGLTLEQSNRANIDKLRGRHGEAFDVFRDANRDLDREHAKLEDDFNKAKPETPLFDNVEVVKNPVEARGDMADMADRIRDANNAGDMKTTRG